MKDIELISEFLPVKDYFNPLLNNIDWQNKLKTESGEEISIHRKMAYVSDQGVSRSLDYTYSKFTVKGQTWTPELLEIRDLLFDKLNIKFNSVLLNLYEDGKDEIKWHSDKEEILGENPVIACVNVGASRKFWFLEKATGVKTPWTVNDRDLLIMGENCQRNYLHAILKEKEVTTARISLTYRLVM